MNDTTLDVEFAVRCDEIPTMVNASSASTSAPTVRAYSINTSTALYDVLYRDLDATDGLARDDGRLYKLAHMYNDAGKVFVEANLDRYLEMQRVSLRPNTFDGHVMRVNSTHVLLCFEAGLPSVGLLQLTFQ